MHRLPPLKDKKTAVWRPFYVKNAAKRVVLSVIVFALLIMTVIVAVLSVPFGSAESGTCDASDSVSVSCGGTEMFYDDFTAAMTFAAGYETSSEKKVTVKLLGDVTATETLRSAAST